jgi:hypothetical protein
MTVSTVHCRGVGGVHSSSLPPISEPFRGNARGTKDIATSRLGAAGRSDRRGFPFRFPLAKRKRKASIQLYKYEVFTFVIRRMLMRFPASLCAPTTP